MNIRVEGNPTNEKTETVSKDNVKLSEEKKTKPKYPIHFLQRIISLLKKEELI